MQVLCFFGNSLALVAAIDSDCIVHPTTMVNRRETVCDNYTLKRSLISSSGPALFSLKVQMTDCFPTKLIKWINQRGHASYVSCGLQPCVQKCIGLLQRIPKITCSSMSKRDLRQVKNLRSIFQAQSFSHFVLALSLGVLSFHKTQVNQKEQQPLLLVITLWRINPSKMTFSTT